MFENEEWVEIEDFPHYHISQYGRVKRLDSTEARKVTLNDKGFPIITLYGQDSKTRYLRQINKLVATAFLPPPQYPDMTYVWHLDGDLSNCNVSNLRWDTRSRVLEWNEMHRARKPKYETPRVMNNRTGITYENALECALSEGRLESEIVWRVERQARSFEDPDARYRYILSDYDRLDMEAEKLV